MSDFKAKMHQIRFPLGLCPRPRWGAYNRSPDPLAGIRGPLRDRGGEQEGMEQGKGKGDRGNGRDGTVHGTGGKGKEKRKGREREERGYSPLPGLQFLAPPLLIWTPHFVNPGSAPDCEEGNVLDVHN